MQCELICALILVVDGPGDHGLGFDEAEHA